MDPRRLCVTGFAGACLASCQYTPRTDAQGLSGATMPEFEGDGTDTGPSPDASSTAADGRLDLGSDGPVQCIACTLTLDSRQSGALTVENPSVLGTAMLQGQVVYSLGEIGNGRFIVSADSSLVLQEQTDCPLRQWLAGTNDPEPAIFVFGFNHDTDVLGEPMPSSVHLPEHYIGAPDELAADYDIVVYLEESEFLDEGAEPTDEEVQTLLAYVQLHRGGLVVSSEYANGVGGYLSPRDLSSVNRIMKPLGFEALEVDLSWGDAHGSIDFTCFPPTG